MPAPTPHAALARLPLNGLRAAEAVARHGGLRGAAEELGVSPGAVSQQVAKLEAVLGRALFDRRPGGMAPATEAEDILRRLADGFRQLAAAAELARRDRAHVLTISVAPIFAARWLIWRLGNFTSAHPEIKVRIDSDPALADPNGGDIDFAVRIGPGGYPGVRCEWLFDQRIVPVCAPGWANRIAQAADLARVPVIREPRAMFSWDDWLGPEGLDATMLGDGPEFSDASLCLDAAMAGGGVFLAFETLCRDALDRGQIVAPLPTWRKTAHAYWLVSAADRSMSRPQRLFRAWLTEALAGSGMGGDL